MCLGAPGKVVEIEGTTALVDFFGVRRRVALDIVDEEVAVGDYVLVHVGFAIRRIHPDDLDETLAFFAEMAEGSDPSLPGAP
ncbi:MAG: HypC/HybG/HupF family hydrogenase formation chaperone [Myxococcales bacterium]|jgi:hydrogenase expression/formation protein HypC|nr:HypC/HybG/HupF family hydrogenase formation chaperone [Myxococcales bacterium]MBL9110823.1 HypC/HybG/HupF family hydrogenase formation chaperone [Myxococcales bacterium]